MPLNVYWNTLTVRFQFTCSMFNLDTFSSNTKPTLLRNWRKTLRINTWNWERLQVMHILRCICDCDLCIQLCFHTEPIAVSRKHLLRRNCPLGWGSRLYSFRVFPNCQITIQLTVFPEVAVMSPGLYVRWRLTLECAGLHCWPRTQLVGCKSR